MTPVNQVRYAFQRDGENLIVGCLVAPGGALPVHRHPRQVERGSRWDADGARPPWRCTFTLILVPPQPGTGAVGPHGQHLLTGHPDPGRASTLLCPPAASLTALTLATALAVLRPWGAPLRTRAGTAPRTSTAEEQVVKIRAAYVITIVLFAVVMGVFWGTWVSLSRTMNQLSAQTFVAVGHEMISNLGVLMAILLPLALLSAMVTGALLWRARRAAAFWWMLAGFILMAAALVITLAVEVPIDSQIQSWTAATLPGDWRQVQSRWELFHTIRTFASVAAVAGVTISAVAAARPGQRPRAARLRARAVAGQRPA